MTNSNQLPLLPRIMYGIWIPGAGWLKSPQKDGVNVAYAEVRPEIARRYAQWIGNGAQVEPIDPSLVAIEYKLLQYEKDRKERKKIVLGTPRRLLDVFVGWSKKQWVTLTNSNHNPD